MASSNTLTCKEWRQTHNKSEEVKRQEHKETCVPGSIKLIYSKGESNSHFHYTSKNC